MNDRDNQIEKNRTCTVHIDLKRNGKPLTGMDVRVAQMSHKFQFGSNWCNDFIALANGELSGKQAQEAEKFAELFFGLCNQATLPFYWGQFEPKQGKPRTQQLMNLAKWYKKHGIAVKGHPLCWHTLAPDWLLPLDTDEILKIQLERIKRDVTEFQGIIDSWDVVNETVIMPIFDKYDNGITRICQKLGRIELLRSMFDAARKSNPNGTFLINDFNTSPAYEKVIEECLSAGIKFDAIGIQSHMHQGYWGPEKTLEILQRFERFELPIHFTENTIISGNIMPPEIDDLNDYQVSDWPSTPEGEDRQAREVVTHIKTLLSHPLVESITWWDIKDGAWLNAPSGLFRKDGSAKPAYHALVELLKQNLWYSPQNHTTNSSGRVEFHGPLGNYELHIEGKKIQISMENPGQQHIDIDLA